ncbi:hypothetical protein D9M68_896940 [compost metagenome]
MGVIRTSSEMVMVSGLSPLRARYLVSTSVPAQSAAAVIGISACQPRLSVPTPETMMAPTKPIMEAARRAEDTLSPRNRAEPRMMKSGPVARRVTICQIGTPEAKP